jgi:hypothetical protein
MQTRVGAGPVQVVVPSVIAEVDGAVTVAMPAIVVGAASAGRVGVSKHRTGAVGKSGGMGSGSV